ncbi:MAG: stage II sporulation protein R, partial [Tumebacillaceae bacterium]
MKKRLVLVAVAVMVALTAGVSAAASALAQKQEAVQTVAAPTSIIEEDTGVIPGDAIRLRIIANSDDPADQKLKRDVRDQIIAAVAVQVRGTQNADEARAKIRAAVPEMNTIAEKVIKEKGYSYPVKTDFGMVPFPTKLYGDQVYPAGNYEALR